MKRMILLCILFIVFGCKKQDSGVKTVSEMEDKINSFYESSGALDYMPIHTSEIDTTELILNIDSSLIRLTGFVTHEFMGRSNSGIKSKYTDTIDVTVFKSSLIIIPRGY